MSFRVPDAIAAVIAAATAGSSAGNPLKRIHPAGRHASVNIAAGRQGFESFHAGAVYAGVGYTTSSAFSHTLIGSAGGDCAKDLTIFSTMTAVKLCRGMRGPGGHVRCHAPAVLPRRTREQPAPNDRRPP